MALQIARQWDIYVGRTPLDFGEELEANGDGESATEMPSHPGSEEAERGRGLEEEGSKRGRHDEHGRSFVPGGSAESRGLICAKDNYREMKKVILNATSYIMETAFML